MVNSLIQVLQLEAAPRGQGAVERPELCNALSSDHLPTPRGRHYLSWRLEDGVEGGYFWTSLCLKGKANIIVTLHLSS